MVFDKFRFVERFAVANRAVPNGVAAIAAPKSRTACGGLPANTGLSDFIRRAEDSDQSGEPNGVAITAAPKARIARGGNPAKFRFATG